MIKFNDEASIQIGRNNFIELGKEGAYEVVVFGGSKMFHRHGRLFRNHKLSKDFPDKTVALQYYSNLRQAYNKFVKENPENDGLQIISENAEIQQG